MTRTHEGELLAVLLCLLESFFPVLSLMAIPLIGALNTYCITLCIAIVVLIVVLGLTEGYAGLSNRKAQKYLLLTAFFITLLFLLIFLGLQYTTAGNMAVIMTLQLFFSYLYFNVFGRENMDRVHTFGAFLMGIGAIVILIPKNFTVNSGDILVCCAAAVAPVANLYQKRARKYVSTVTILTYRYIAALPFVLIMALSFEGLPTVESLLEALPWLAAIAVLIYVLSKILWIEALHRIGITKISAMFSLTPIFTLLFAFLLLHEIPDSREIIGVFAVLGGAYLITQSVS